MHPIWKGFLQISLATIPVKLSPVTAAGSTLRYHQLHAVCRSRLQPPSFCPRCNCDVAEEEIVKGYRYADQRYLLIADEEPERIELPGPAGVTLLRFADQVELAEMDFDDRAYCVSPDGPNAAEGHAALRDTMRERGRIAFGACALEGQEHTVALVPREQDLLLHIVRPAAMPRSRKARLGEGLPGRFDLTVSREGYRQAFRGLIEAEVGGQRPPRPQASEVGRSSAPTAASPWSKGGGSSWRGAGDLLDEFERSADERPLVAADPAARTPGGRRRRWAFAGVACLLLAAAGGAAIWYRPFIEVWLRPLSSVLTLTGSGGAPADAGPLVEGSTPPAQERPAPATPYPPASGTGAPAADVPGAGASAAASPRPESPSPLGGGGPGSTGEPARSTGEQTATPSRDDRPAGGPAPERPAPGGPRPGQARGEPWRPSARLAQREEPPANGKGHRQAATALPPSPSPWILWTRSDRADGLPGGQLLIGEWRPTESLENDSACRQRLIQSFQPAQGGGWVREAGQEQIRAGCRPAAAGPPGS